MWSTEHLVKIQIPESCLKISRIFSVIPQVPLKSQDTTLQQNPSEEPILFVRTLQNVVQDMYLNIYNSIIHNNQNLEIPPNADQE